MKKLKKLSIFLTVALTCALLVFTFTACKRPSDNDGNGGDNDNDSNYVAPVDVTLTAEKAESVIGALKIDKNSGVRMTYGDYVVEANYKVNGSDYYFHEQYARGDGGTNDLYICKDNSGTTYVMSDNSDRGSYKSRYLADWEVAKEKARFDGIFDYFSVSYIKSSILDSHSRAVKFMGDAAGNVEYSGVKSASGEYELKMQAVVLNDDEPSRATITFKATSDRELTQMYDEAEVLKEYMPDNFDYGTVYGDAVTFEYGDFHTSATGSYKQIESVYLDFANGAVMPNDFVPNIARKQMIAFQTAKIPAPVNSAHFMGWYYDEELQFPVPKDPEDATGKTYILTMVEGYDTQTVYPRWAKKDSGSPRFGDLPADATFSKEDLARMKYTFILSDYRYIEPVRNGYTFVGWYKDKALTQPLSYDDNVIVYDETIYPKFVKNVKISFVADTTYTILPREVQGGAYADLPNAVKKDSVFEGWFTDEQRTVTADAYYPTTDTTYYAKFSDGITINLNTGSDSMPKYITVAKGGDLSDLMAELSYYENEIRYDDSGDYFENWAVDNVGTPITEYPTAEITLYAYYLKPILLSYRFNDKVEAESNCVQDLRRWYPDFSDYLYNLMMGNDLNVPDGKEFDGWYRDADCTVKIAADAPWPTENSTVYGRYIDYKRFNFEFGDGEYTESAENLEYYSRFKYQIDARSVVSFCGLMPAADDSLGNAGSNLKCPEGTYLEGWYTDSALTERFTEYDVLPEKTMTLYAKYAAVSYVTFVLPTKFENYQPDSSAIELMRSISVLDYIKLKVLYENNGDREFNFKDNYINAYPYLGIYNPNAFIQPQGDNYFEYYYFEGYYSDDDCSTPYEFGAEFEPATVYVNWARR